MATRIDHRLGASRERLIFTANSKALTMGFSLMRISTISLNLFPLVLGRIHLSMSSLKLVSILEKPRNPQSPADHPKDNSTWTEKTLRSTIPSKNKRPEILKNRKITKTMTSNRAPTGNLMRKIIIPIWTRDLKNQLLCREDRNLDLKWKFRKSRKSTWS